MAEQVHIAHWIVDLGLGGDAKNLVSLALEQAKWARVSILTAAGALGTRCGAFQDKNIAVVPNMISNTVSNTVLNTLPEWISSNAPDIVVVHRNGAPNDVETGVLLAFSHAGIPCFEYNTFARVDAATDHLWWGHFHLTRASLLQYAKRRSVSPFQLSNHKAIGYAVPVSAAISEEERRDAREELGVPAGKFVVSRIVRPDLRKWDPLPVLAMRRAVARGIDAHFVVQAVPRERRAWLKSQLGNSVSLLEPTAEDARLRLTLAASDVSVNYSVIGETFGLALAEAMAAGLPVIVNSTPHVDNAQIELCRHGQRGLVANTLASLADALNSLYTQPELKNRLGNAGRRYIQETFAADIVEARLRQFVSSCLQASGHELAGKIPQVQVVEDAYQLSDEWLTEYRLSEKECVMEPTSTLERFSDSCLLKLLRLQDALLYAKSIGINGMAEKLQRRLSQGSVFRS